MESLIFVAFHSITGYLQWEVDFNKQPSPRGSRKQDLVKNFSSFRIANYQKYIQMLANDFE